MKIHTYTDKERDFILKNHRGITTMDLTQRFNEEFNLLLKTSQVRSYLRNHHLSNGLDMRFQPGNKPYNTGTKGVSKANSGSFTKGNKPKNYREVGSERVNVDGYIEIKIEEPNKWTPKHRYLYIQKYGPIPKGYKLIFLDGNRLNIDLGNLVLVSDAELCIANNRHLCSKNTDLTRAGITVAKLLLARSSRIKSLRG